MDAFNYLKTKEELERDEGRRNKLYKDTEGVLTIGIGWNIQEKGLPDEIIDHLFEISLEEAENDARSVVETFDELDPARQRVLVNMAFNLGRSRLSGFKKMIAAVDGRDWEESARQMLDSKWARQVGKRAVRLSMMMEHGE